MYIHFTRWAGYGAWYRVAEVLQGDTDLEELFIDAIIFRAQQCCRRTQKTVGISRSRGGLTIKAHACVDTFGHPVRLILTAVQVAGITQGWAFVEAIPNGAVIADKDHNSSALVYKPSRRPPEAIIPPRSNRNTF